ncbi:MAG: TldD/PmbA family protein [Thermodesulfobacteriota bacterium]
MAGDNPLTTGSDDVVDILRGLVEGKTDAYEMYLSTSKGFSVEAKDGAVDAFKARSGRGVGLRTINGGRLGFGFSTVLTREALSEMVAAALEAGGFADPDRFLAFPSPSGGPGGVGGDGLGIFDPGYEAATEDEKIALAVDIERSAMAGDARVKRVRKASYGETFSGTRIVNSNGVDIESSATYFTGSVTAVAEEGDESQMGWEMVTSHARSAIDPAFIGESAAERATSLLGGRNIKTVRCPAVIENTVVCELLDTLSTSFLGDNVAKGKSMLMDKLGSKVASSALDVWDDGVLRGGWATSPFDGEGSPRARTALLARGECAAFLYDTYWARRSGAAPTGNAVRHGYKGLPSVGISNLYIDKGETGLDGLFREMDRGLFITEVLGAHMINAISGDFSLGASGFWVEGGVKAYPARGMAISGNLLDLFARVDRCGSDIRFIGSIGAPSLLVSEIEASGT